MWLSGLHQWWLKWSQLYIREMPQVLIARLRYPHRLEEVRSAATSRPLKVVFPVSNLSKWKMQSVFEAMRQSKAFEPVILLTAMDTETALSAEELRVHLERISQELDRRQMKWVWGYDFENETCIPIAAFKPDIVFYQQPYGIAEVQNPFAASRVALTCYVPYFVQNYGGLDMDCDLFFHRLLWRHFTLSPSWAEVFERYQGRVRRAGRVLGLGHPMLDQFAGAKEEDTGAGLVIYAPHWSCGGIGERYSTFLENGEKMLELAQRHPEIKWVFKPHPTLRQKLIEHRFMTREQVAAYYGAWEKIATSCYDGGYVDLFKKSSVMITDCASFLMEYASTGKPIIHLVAKNPVYQPHPISAKLFDTYYQTHDWNEFEEHFETVILQKKDPKREVRLAAVKEMNLMGMKAGEKIVSYLKDVLGVQG